MVSLKHLPPANQNDKTRQQLWLIILSQKEQRERNQTLENQIYTVMIQKDEKKKIVLVHVSFVHACNFTRPDVSAVE